MVYLLIQLHLGVIPARPIGGGGGESTCLPGFSIEALSELVAKDIEADNAKW